MKVPRTSRSVKCDAYHIQYKTGIRNKTLINLLNMASPKKITNLKFEDKTSRKIISENQFKSLFWVKVFPIFSSKFMRVTERLELKYTKFTKNRFKSIIQGAAHVKEIKFMK
mmetsp:Transcript_8915/g.7910  ORF Transcript_8915/g.7910 Transcript_8915/m.7910 type:complete len:112 (+) Transcript_8915:199-534(+)